MGTTIFIFIIVMLLIVAAYICSKLDDKLLKAKYETKNLRNELSKIQEENAWLRFRIGEAQFEVQRLQHLKDALQKDYDLLYNDYLTLQKEIEK